MERTMQDALPEATPELVETETNTTYDLVWGTTRELPEVDSNPPQMNPKTMEVNRTLGMNVRSLELVEVHGNRIKVAISASLKGLFPKTREFGSFQGKGVPVGDGIMHVIEVKEHAEPPTARVVFLPIH
jgi:hypothetical protein